MHQSNHDFHAMHVGDLGFPHISILTYNYGSEFLGLGKVMWFSNKM